MKFTLVYFLLLIFCNISYTQEDKDSSFYSKLSTISKTNLSRHVKFLGDDLFEGRGTGSLGESLISKYLAIEFSILGLKPIGTDKTFYQPIQMHSSLPLKESQLIIYSEKEQVKLSLNEDYLIFTSGDQTFIPTPIPAMFVGYGIVAPEFDYNDYQEVDVRGKVVIYLEGEPNSKHDNYFDSEKPTLYSFSETKQKIALSRGASGSVLIPSIKNIDDQVWLKLQRDFSFDDVSLAYAPSKNLSILIHPKSAAILFDGSGVSLDNIYQMHELNQIKSFDLKTKISFKGYFKDKDFITSNVIGMIEGKDEELKDKYLIVSAHYDHLGIGPIVNGDSIYNGVLDNSIGVAGLLEIARFFTQNHLAIKRSLIFLLLTGEEKGLLGSKFYTDNPLVPLYNTVANINIDGLAVFGNFESIIGIGAEFSNLGDYLKNAAGIFDVDIQEIPQEFENYISFYQSDQASFAMAGIPSILVYDAPTHVGLSQWINYSKNIYHTPFDNLKQKINYNAAIKHLKIITGLIYNLANSDEEPEWKDNSPFLNTRLRSKAEKK